MMTTLGGRIVRDLGVSDIQTALSIVREQLKSSPADVGAHLRYAELLTAAFQHDAALVAIERAVAAAGGAAQFKAALDRKVCVVVSNCHGKAIRATFAEVPAFEERYLVVGVYNRDAATIPKAITEIADVLIFQATTWSQVSEDALVKGLSSAVQVIRFPAAMLSALWPYYTRAPSKTDESGRPVYRYAYGDRFIDQRVKLGMAPDAIVAEYMSRDVPSDVNLLRLMEIESAKEHEKERQCEIRVRGFIEDNFHRIPVFHTPNHPTQPVINHMANQIARHLDLAVDPETLSRAEYPETSATQHPIHPSIAQHLGLPYVPPQAKFRMARSTALSFEEFIPRYIAGSI